jgi:hypothetical protein
MLATAHFTTAAPQEAPLGEPVTVAEGAQITIAGADLAIEVTAIYDRCVTGVACETPPDPRAYLRVRDLDTEEEVYVGELAPQGAALWSPGSFAVVRRTGVDPAVVSLLETDGHDYARVAMHDAAAWCGSYMVQRAANACWTQLAIVTGRESHCDRLTTVGLSPESCVEALAEASNRPELCERVGAARGWCARQPVRQDVPCCVTAPHPTQVVAYWANPASYTGSCPVVIRFHSRLIGDWSTVTYQWVRSDGVRTQEEDIAFSAPPSRTEEHIATLAWEVTESAELSAVIEVLKDISRTPLPQRAGRPVTKVVCVPESADSEHD